MAIKSEAPFNVGIKLKYRIASIRFGWNDRTCDWVISLLKRRLPLIAEGAMSKDSVNYDK